MNREAFFISGEEGAIFELGERIEELIEEAKKRQRNYSQSAINTEDLTRLNDLKTHHKEHHKLSVSNQTILSAALDALGENMEDFLKSLVMQRTNRQREKDLKQ